MKIEGNVTRLMEDEFVDAKAGDLRLKKPLAESVGATLTPSK